MHAIHRVSFAFALIACAPAAPAPQPVAQTGAPSATTEAPAPTTSAPAPTASAKPASPCEKLPECASDGLCSGEGMGSCTAASNADCERSNLCKSMHHCEAKDGECVFSAKSCRESRWCSYAGACVERPHDSWASLCQPGADADCANSKGCAENGNCKMGKHPGFPQPVCIADDSALCKKSTGCKKEGNCAAITHRQAPPIQACGPASDADCKQSDACTKDGRCKYDGAEAGGVQSCVKP